MAIHKSKHEMAWKQLDRLLSLQASFQGGTRGTGIGLKTIFILFFSSADGRWGVFVGAFYVRAEHLSKGAETLSVESLSHVALFGMLLKQDLQLRHPCHLTNS